MNTEDFADKFLLECGPVLTRSKHQFVVLLSTCDFSSETLKEGNYYRFLSCPECGATGLYWKYMHLFGPNRWIRTKNNGFVDCCPDAMIFDHDVEDYKIELDQLVIDPEAEDGYKCKTIFFLKEKSPYK